MTTPEIIVPTTPAPHPAEQGVKSALVGIGVNLVLACGKAAAGIWGHSYALVADAIESGMDILSSTLVLIGLKVAAKPADENHPHGHGKAEPLATVAVALFLFLAAYEIARQSIHEIQNPHTMPAPWTLAVLVAVVIIKEMLFRFVRAIGEKAGSEAVKSDAQHQRSDVITSGAAFIGISVALIGSYYSPDPRWSSADDWAALLASGWVAWNGWCILRVALMELTDARLDTALEVEVRRIAQSVPGVTGTDKCVIRKSGFDYYVELDVEMNEQTPLLEAHEIAHAVQDAVRAQVINKRIARVLVHPEPAPESATI